MAIRKAAVQKKYSTRASEQVGAELHEMKKGTLKSGNNGNKVTNPKQAIAIGLSKARRAGAKVPPPPRKSAGAKESSTKKTPARKASS